MLDHSEIKNDTVMTKPNDLAHSEPLSRARCLSKYHAAQYLRIDQQRLGSKSINLEGGS